MTINFVEPARGAGRRFVTTRALEKTLVDLVRVLREREIAPLVERLEVLENSRLDSVSSETKARRSFDDVEARVARGESVAGHEWLSYIARLQRRDAGEFDPARHSSWRSG